MLALVVGGHPVETAAVGVEVQVVLNQTPFYAESGGQVGDTGTLRTDRARVAITDVRKKAGLFVHLGRVEEGDARPRRRRRARRRPRPPHARSAPTTRRPTCCTRRCAARSATTSPSAAAWSRPTGCASTSPTRKAMTAEELAAVEAEVNDYVRQNTPVETRIMTPDAAERLGARALFGEKYGDEVRVVVDGRPPGQRHRPGRRHLLARALRRHPRRGAPATSAPSSSSPRARPPSGVRRVEALTGAGALAHVAAEEAALAEAAALLRARPDELPERIRALLDERRAQANEIADLRRRLALAGGPAEAKGPETVAGIPFLAQSLSGVSGKDLRGLIDEHKARLGSGVILLVADTGDKAAVAAGVTDDLTGRVSAVDLVRVAAEALGGKGGGGRPDMAQAGGADPAPRAAGDRRRPRAARGLRSRGEA